MLATRQRGMPVGQMWSRLWFSDFLTFGLQRPTSSPEPQTIIAQSHGCVSLWITSANECFNHGFLYSSPSHTKIIPGVSYGGLLRVSRFSHHRAIFQLA